MDNEQEWEFDRLEEDDSTCDQEGSIMMLTSTSRHSCPFKRKRQRRRRKKMQALLFLPLILQVSLSSILFLICFTSSIPSTEAANSQLWKQQQENKIHNNNNNNHPVNTRLLQDDQLHHHNHHHASSSHIFPKSSINNNNYNYTSSREEDYFKLLVQDGGSLLVGSRNMIYNISLPSLIALQLKNLTIRIQSPSSQELVASPAFLSPQRQSLEYLDLGFNSMSSLPDDLFCPLTNLKLLNLTRNKLIDFKSLGLVDHSTGHLCLQELQVLDLSHNKIQILTETGVASLKNLRALYLNGNQINTMAELSLSALSKLNTIDLSHNRLSMIPSRLFRDSSELRHLFLQNNSIYQLPTELFKGLSKLFVLNLSYNEIGHESLTRETFLDLIRVVYLDLSHNRIKKINGSIFESQYSLQALNLQDNAIQEILPNAFSSLYNLDTLILTSNSLKSLSAQSLNGLYVLKKLFLNENEISRISEVSFANCSSLTHLSLDGNLLTEIPRAVSHLKRLEVLNLRDNAITHIVSLPASSASNSHNKEQHQQASSASSSSPSTSSAGTATFQGLQSLEQVDLSLNKIVNVTRGSFTDMPALKDLNLSSNHIRSCDHGVFDDAPLLREIHLENNNLIDINGLFMNLGSLRSLNVSRNKIAWFDYALIPKELTHLDLHSNKIEELGNYFDLSGQLQLKWLDVSKNILARISVNALPNRVEELNMESNLIASVAHFSFQNKPNLKRVNLRNNSLPSLDSSALQLDQSSSDLPVFHISKNPFSCDCNMEWMQGLTRREYFFSASSSTPQTRYPNIIDLMDVNCKLPTSKDNVTVSLLSTDPSSFLCKYKSHCFALCHCCDFDACDCEMMCPENCTCFYDSTWNTNIVDCSVRGYHSIPSRIPMDVTELYVDGNDIPSLSSLTFIGRKNMRVLHLNNSGIHVINNRTFNGLKNLQILNLNHNHLTQLSGYEFEKLFDLKDLYLSYNKIGMIASHTFKEMRNLKVLHLDHNFIMEFSVWSLAVNTRLVEVTLSHNLWSCECKFLKQYSSWLSESRDIVLDARKILCFYNDSASMSLLSPDFNLSSCTMYSSSSSSSSSGKMASSGVASNSPFSNNSSDNNNPNDHLSDYVPVAIVAAGVFILVLVSLTVVGVYRKEVSIWLFSRYGVRFQGRSDAAREEEKLFHCFISYSKMDEAFVNQILSPELEYGKPPFRLCLHYRDLPVASGYLSDAIVEAMMASRRTILVISDNFLKNEWCRYEFKSAHLEVLRSNHRHKLILVFIGKISDKDLDPDIRFWLKTSTFLQWGEKMFWEKLRYAMPDVSTDVRALYATQTRNMSGAVHV